MEYQSKNPNVQVVGGAVLAFVNALTNKELGLKYLENHGIKDIQPDKFYSQQAYLNALQDLVKAIGVPSALEGVGEKIPDYLSSINAKDIFEMFETWINHYRAANPGDNESYFKVIEKGDKYLFVETNNPVACAFDRGLIRAFARRFQPSAKVTHHSEKCRAKGDGTCTYHVFW